MSSCFLSLSQAKSLAKKYETPLFVISKRKLEENFKTLSRCLPNVKLFYALKANPHMEIAKTVVELGGNLDVSSLGELDIAKRLRIAPQRIIYTQPIKKESEIKAVHSYGIDLFIFDNEVELEKIARSAKGSRVLLRIKVSNPYCVVDLSEKFGADPSLAQPLFKKAKNLGLNPCGIAFHVGSQTINPLAYVRTLITVKKMFDLLAIKGMDMSILDIGGGFPISYLDQIISIESFCEPIYYTLENYFHNVEIIAEPGRFIVGDACALICEVVGKAERDGIVWYYIDDGLYGTFSGKVYDHADYPIVSEEKGAKSPCVIAGPTCDSFDVVFRNRVLPELDVGDILIFPDVGAYTLSSASEFNGIKRPRVIVLEEVDI